MKFYALFKRRHLARVAQAILRIMDSVSWLIHNTDKRKLIMRINLTVILLTASLLQVSAGGFAQKINLTKTNISLTEVFKEIRKQSGYDFVYATPQIKLARKVDVLARNSSLSDVLEKCFLNQPFTYEIQNKTIVIKARTDAAIVSDRKIQGTVLDKKDGTPLAGVTVLVKGTKVVGQTDAKGKFTLNVPDGSETLIIRFLGFKTQEIALANFVNFTIRMEEDQQALDAVVVNGIFERSVGNSTGAVKAITGDELKMVSSNNVFTAIAALDPSLRVMPNNIVGGNINQLPDIQLRGANSFPNLSGELSANPNSPLFILDGFEVGIQRIVDLDMNMIKSITILKDASATSIYGSRGANGVLVITSITPKAGKMQFTYNNDFRLTTPDLSVYNLLNATEKLDFEKRVGIYQAQQAGGQFQLDQIYNDRRIAIAKGVNTDWLAFPVQTGVSNRSSLYLQGGDDYIRYGLNVSADLQKGVMKGQNRNNYSAQFDLSYNINKMRFQNSIRVSQIISNESPYGSFSQYVKMNPYWRPYDEKGNPNRVLENNALGLYVSPLFDATLNTVNKTQYYGISNNFSARYDMLPYLYVESKISLNKQNGSTDQFYAAQHSRFKDIKDLSLKGSYDVSNNNTLGYESTTAANFTKLFGKHQVYGTLGFNIMSSTINSYSINTVGFPFDGLDNLLFAAQYKPNARPTGQESTVRTMGLFLQGNYAYDNRYLVDLTIRRDGSSQYGTNNRYGTFWAAGLGWNLHNEAFMKDISGVNRFKLRANYGSTGTRNLPAYRSQTRYNFGINDIYDGELGASIMGLGNQDLKWQEVHKLNFGADIDLFNERLNMRAEYYVETAVNTLTNITLAPSTGFADFTENLGKVQNKGLELYGRYKIIDNKRESILWSVNAGALTNKNTLKELSNKLKSTNKNEDAKNKTQTVPNVILQEGQSLGTIFVVKSLGVDPTTGAEVYQKKDGTTTLVWNAADKIAYGVTDPKWNGVFGTNLSYKGFEIGMIFNYQFGGQMYNQTLADRVEGAAPEFNVDRRAYDLGWAKPGDEVPYTKFGLNAKNVKLTSRFVQDNNILNMTSGSIGYNFFKHAFLKKVGLRSLQLTAITNDLFTVSSIKIERGTDNPFARTYSLSLRAGF